MGLTANDDGVGHLLPASGSVVGGALGGVILWFVGKAAFVDAGAATDVTFFLAITSLIFAVVSPFVIAGFVRSRVSGKAKKELVTIGGFVLALLFFIAVGLVGLVFFGDLSSHGPFEGIAYLDAIAGVVYGGIIGWEVTEWVVDRRQIASEPDPWS